LVRLLLLPILLLLLLLILLLILLLVLTLVLTLALRLGHAARADQRERGNGRRQGQAIQYRSHEASSSHDCASRQAARSGPIWTLGAEEWRGTVLICGSVTYGPSGERFR